LIYECVHFDAWLYVKKHINLTCMLNKNWGRAKLKKVKKLGVKFFFLSLKNLGTWGYIEYLRPRIWQIPVHTKTIYIYLFICDVQETGGSWVQQHVWVIAHYTTLLRVMLHMYLSSLLHPPFIIKKLVLRERERERQRGNEGCISSISPLLLFT
jgi:hypothetical protein